VASITDANALTFTSISFQSPDADNISMDEAFWRNASAPTSPDTPLIAWLVRGFLPSVAVLFHVAKATYFQNS